MENIVKEPLTNGVEISYKKKTNVDFYGDSVSYIHLKFGHACKRCFFTSEFQRLYGLFAKNYLKFFDGKENDLFKTDLDVVKYIKSHNIPVLLYQNWLDLEFLNIDEAIKYIENYKED